MVKRKWEKVGVIGVDAGLCWLGDPCYIMGEDASSHPAKTWAEFCAKLSMIEKGGVAIWNYKLGHEGLGITVSTGYGDGTYPVFVKRNSESRIIEVKVVFDM